VTKVTVVVITVVMTARATTANADLLADDAACSLSPCGCYVGDWFTATSTGCGVQVPVERIAPLLADARIMRTNAKTRQKYLWVIALAGCKLDRIT
jgi:hypothetical protein